MLGIPIGRVPNIASRALQRSRELIRRDGLAAVSRTAASRLVAVAYLNEDHVWYALDLSRVERLPLAEGYELRRGGPADTELMIELRGTAAAAEEANVRLAEGVDLWLVMSGDEAAFGCWIFPHTAPTIAAAGGALELSPGISCLEDSYANPAHRGRGLAGAAWTAIGAELKADGKAVLITKVAVDNVPSRKAVTKAGFREVHQMHLRRRGPSTRVSFSDRTADLTESEQAAAQELERGLATNGS